jgi:hypothetical protein
MNVRFPAGSAGFRRRSSGVRIDLRAPRAPAAEGRRRDYEAALRSTEDALGLLRHADGRLQTAAARLGGDTGDAAAPRERLESVLTHLARLQTWLVAAIDDLTTVGENDAAARSALEAVVPGEGGEAA